MSESGGTLRLTVMNLHVRESEDLLVPTRHYFSKYSVINMYVIVFRTLTHTPNANSEIIIFLKKFCKITKRKQIK